MIKYILLKRREKGLLPVGEGGGRQQGRRDEESRGVQLGSDPGADSFREADSREKVRFPAGRGGLTLEPHHGHVDPSH